MLGTVALAGSVCLASGFLTGSALVAIEIPVAVGVPVAPAPTGVAPNSSAVVGVISAPDALIALPVSAVVDAQSLPAMTAPQAVPSGLREVAKKVAQFQLAQRCNDNNWITGTFYAGIAAMYSATGDKFYLNACEKLGKKLKWKIPVAKPNSAESGANLLTLGQMYLENFFVTGDEHKIKPLITSLENPLSKNPTTRPLDWYYESERRYADSLFTGPPTLVMLSAATRNEKYLQQADAMFWDVFGELFDGETNLFYRDKRFFPCRMRTKNRKKIIWSRGNG
jgi:rhamnogalacturonyl hydrolase YesR